MANKKIPMRQCVGCHEMKAKNDMIRVIKTTSEESEDAVEIMLETTGRKNGRGAYLWGAAGLSFFKKRSEHRGGKF